MKTNSRLLSVSLLILVHAPFAGAAVARPPQFVMMAFDNCTENWRWEELRDFESEMDQDQKPVRFTFFVSGVNFIPNSERKSYQGPHHLAGRADIDFAGSKEDVRTRVGHMHALYEAGNEIASHAVGHFDGSEWSKDDWRQELTTFHNLLVDGFNNNGFSDGHEILSALSGFRAPYLGAGPGMFSALSSLHYRYDTSTDGDAQAWPVKKDGLWRFPLANLRINGSDKKTLSMDYNFFAAQSGAKEDPAHRSTYRDQMLATYKAYFLKNYTGNRAPLNIGHHFFGYQGGVYNEALKQFARRVCGLPEVRCVTYRELADYMDAQSSETVKAYQNGSFTKAAAPF